jgi:4-amino-4-deoxy-L-arabinose transferase-like glycosyltransferase
LQRSTLAKRLWLLIFAGIAGYYLWGLGALPLVGPDEPRYAEVAREMLARRDLITPTLGGLPWFEKPPLLYWLVMASYRVLGVNEYAARVGPALCGLLSALFVYWIGRTVRKISENTDSTDKSTSDLASVAALIFLSSVGAIVFSRGASFDIVVTMSLTGALASFFAWHVRTAGTGRSISETRHAGLLAAFYFFIGLSLLAKGLIGIVIPAGVIGFYFLLRREWPPRRFLLSIIWGAPLALAIAAIWYGPMIQRHGWTFIDQFIIQHHFARFATNKYHHSEPFYFYLPVLAGLTLPWTAFLIAALVSARRWLWRGAATLDRVRVFAFAWVIIPLIFFSISQSKLTAYILPVMPAVALLGADRFECFRSMDRGNKVMRLTGVLVIVLAGAGIYSTRDLGLNRLCVVSASFGLLAVGVIALARPQLRRTLLLMIPLATFLAATIALACVAPDIAPRESVRDLLASASARGYGGTRVVQLHTVERAAEFYAAGRITYRSDGEPVKLEGVNQVVDAARGAGGTVLCFVPIVYEWQLKTSREVQTQEIGNNGWVALVAIIVK